MSGWVGVYEEALIYTSRYVTPHVIYFSTYYKKNKKNRELDGAFHASTGLRPLDSTRVFLMLFRGFEGFDID